ncbi:MAG: DUF2029 domain-containing protein [Bacteroidetes bacterium]|nr:MAG: DUF2029 domain-containing protein [Bacteroidota bacterium]RLD82714.1 MAG: DUF2029 domain-containing protein [Bacteroidota bacterium]
MKKIFELLTKNYTPVFIIFVLLSLTASIQAILLGFHDAPDGSSVTYYNNFIIFKQSFFHLIENKDLYITYPEEHWDLYKYSPAFALLFAPLALLPVYLGLILWNILNTLVLFFAIKNIPNIANRYKIFMFFIVAIEMMTSVQNAQSNSLIAGLFIFSFIFMEKKNFFVAALFITLTVYIKLFGLVAFSLFLFYPKRLKFISYSALWMALFAILPLIIIPYSQLTFLYNSWAHLLVNDHTTSFGLSVLGWLNAWFNISVNKNLLLLTGAIIFMIPFVKIKHYNNYAFRLMMLASVLIWVVIFNHKAESPTFIIAMSGVVIWYYSMPRKTGDTILLILAFIFTSLSVTDIFPSFIRHDYFSSYVIKAVPCIFIWGKLIYDLLFNIKKTEKLKIS